MVHNWNLIGYVIWNPSPALFSWNLPLLGRPILWYGVLFSMGILLGYRIFRSSVTSWLQEEGVVEAEREGLLLSERFFLYGAVGILLGARLFDLLFYQDLTSYRSHPWDLLALWQGGLASHGGIGGLLAAGALFARRHLRNGVAGLRGGAHWRAVIDCLAVPGVVAGACIRLGNLMNQEILGTPTGLPWGFLFLRPAGGESLLPRHPVQLYEALFYLLLAGLFALPSVRRACSRGKRGRIAGALLMVLSLFRFAIEWLKEEQSVLFTTGHTLLPSFLNMAQYLTLPLFLAGLVLFLGKQPSKNTLPVDRD